MLAITLVIATSTRIFNLDLSGVECAIPKCNAKIGSTNLCITWKTNNLLLRVPSHYMKITMITHHKTLNPTSLKSMVNLTSANVHPQILELYETLSPKLLYLEEPKIEITWMHERVSTCRNT